jgi:hypothetical protein
MKIYLFALFLVISYVLEAQTDTTKNTELIKVQNLGGVIVKAPGIPRVVFGSEQISVADFELFEQGELLLLTYSRTLKKGSELVLYDGRTILKKLSVLGDPTHLTCDYTGNPVVMCEDKVFSTRFSNKVLQLQEIERKAYDGGLALIIDTHETKVVYSNFNPYYPSFNYFIYDTTDSSRIALPEIQDDLMMELYRSEYKWVDIRTKLWAKNLELQTGIDAEIYVGANYFTQSLYYKEPYAPLFLKNDTILLFDYCKSVLYKFDLVGEKIDSISINHHLKRKQTGWRNELIQDKKTGDIYALFSKNGNTYVCKMDLISGELHQKVQLEYKYVEKVQVYDNHAYYVYRPFESAQKKYVYSERLPYN